jgi:hypothetical protein
VRAASTEKQRGCSTCGSTFVLVHVGWLMFRETDTQMLLVVELWRGRRASLDFIYFQF